ncbi:carbohydrate kinase family protein [Roseibium sediminis]|uniref:carbohydrate kinase family protein n=1 Tax=Roseibium sediminis TaxID=1775174 RepID=UPI00123CB1BA|nr:carbohydrate kinase [Roseibium sediminis]
MILVCGEALFDLFSDTASGSHVPFDALIGGSPFNVAVGLARLEEKVAFFGGISTDTLGQKLVDQLEKEGVDTSHIHRSKALTTLSLVQKDAHGVPAYTFYGEGAADRMVHEEHLPKLAAPASFIHVGSYTALVKPVSDSLKTLIAREREFSLISFDPNIRPTVEADMDLWRKNTDELAASADLIKVSDEDLSLIHPGKDPADVARAWIKAGTGIVVVTRGGDGATAFTSILEISVAGRKVDVIDTVGAGDTFQAALLAGLVDRSINSRAKLHAIDSNTLQDLLETAVEAAAITCSRKGADLPHRQEVAGFAAVAK